MLVLQVLVSVLYKSHATVCLHFAQFLLRAYPGIEPADQANLEWHCARLGSSENNKKDLVKWIEEHITRDGETLVLTLLELIIVTHHHSTRMIEHPITDAMCMIIGETARRYDDETLKTAFADQLRMRLRSYARKRMEELHPNQMVRPVLEGFLYEKLN